MILSANAVQLPKVKIIRKRIHVLFNVQQTDTSPVTLRSQVEIEYHLNGKEKVLRKDLMCAPTRLYEKANKILREAFSGLRVDMGKINWEVRDRT